MPCFNVARTWIKRISNAKVHLNYSSDSGNAGGPANGYSGQRGWNMVFKAPGNDALCLFHRGPMPRFQERTRWQLLPAAGVTLVLRELSARVAKSDPRSWRRTNDLVAPSERLWMLMYCYSRPRPSPRADPKLEMPNGRLPSGSALNAQSRSLPTPRSPAKRSDADRGLPS